MQDAGKKTPAHAVCAEYEHRSFLSGAEEVNIRWKYAPQFITLSLYKKIDGIPGGEVLFVGLSVCFRVACALKAVDKRSDMKNPSVYDMDFSGRDVGIPFIIALEFRNGSARATTTIGRFIRELLSDTLGDQEIEHVYLDSEYTGEAVWRFIVDAAQGLGADLTMCIKRNPKVKQYIKAFLETKPTWLFYDEQHTYTEQTFTIPIRKTDKVLTCVLKRKESTAALRCFGSTIAGLDSRAILSEYGTRWIIESGIKDLVANYFLDNNPGIDPHRINIHYFIVTLARTLFEMLSRDYREARNPDGGKKTIGTLRSEFLTGANAVLSCEKDEMVLTWKDAYPQKQHEAIKALLDKLNKQKSRELPFLGGLKIRFEIAAPRSENFRNQLKRQLLEI